MAENTNDMVGAIRALVQSELVDVNTSISAVVVSYKDGLATIKPTANKLFADGDSLPYPEIPNVPIRWPSFNGGQAGFKGPVRPGDEVLVVFSQQATDGSDDMRRFDLSDAYAVPASNKQVAQAVDNDTLVMWFGDAYIRITSAGKVEINAPGGTSITAPKNEFSGDATIAGKANINGATTLGSTVSASGKATLSGGFESSGSATNNGKDIGSMHKHIGVQAGGGTSGPVV